MSRPQQTTKRLIDPKRDAIGSRIRTKRELLGFTTEELGAMIGVTGNAVTQYETGRAAPKPQRFEAIALALGTSTTWLLTGHEPDELARAQTRLELETLAAIRELSYERQEMAINLIRALGQKISSKPE